MDFPSTVVRGMVAVRDGSRPQGVPQLRAGQENTCGLQRISPPAAPRAAEAGVPLAACVTVRELRKGTGEADGSWWVVVCFN